MWLRDRARDWLKLGPASHSIRQRKEEVSDQARLPSPVRR